MKITYEFTMENDTKYDFHIELNEKTLRPTAASHLPEWTKLEFYQCKICPLKAEEYPHCPAATAIAGIIEKFSKLVSFDKTLLKVITSNRTISAEVSVQKGLSSLIGLLMAVSGCPYTKFLKPMAYFHLPLASEEETLFRAVSTHLLSQYIKGEDQNLTTLEENYENLIKVNKDFSKRLREATEEDASVNAIILLDLYARAMPFVIKDSLNELKFIFSDS